MGKQQADTSKTFTIGVNEGIVLRTGSPSLYSPVYGVWPKGTQFRYDSVRVSDGYVWLGGTDSNGTRIYIPVGPNDGDKTIFGDWLLGMTYFESSYLRRLFY